MQSNQEISCQGINVASGVWFYWLPVVAYAGLIFFLSSLSAPEAYTPSLLYELDDKTLHAVEYGLLSILCHRAFRHAAGTWAARYALILAIAASVGYAMTDEIHQAFVPLREPDAWDLVADSIGASVAALVWNRTVGP